jgi:hypothetical protein
MWAVIIFPTIRLSQVVFRNSGSTEVFIFPYRAEIEQWRGVLQYLAGIEDNSDNHPKLQFNWILCNGDRSDPWGVTRPKKFTHMMPEGAHSRIRSVDVHHDDVIYGF